MLNRMELIRIFSVAAQSTTFRDAATRLGTSPQTVTRAIEELERTLGELLFHRSTRQVHVTAFGAKLAVQARETLDRVDQLFIANSKQEVKGAVGITAPHAIGKLYLIEFLKPLMLENPGLSIDLSLDDQLTDAVANKIDIGIRVGAVRDRRYIARTVAHVDLKIVAAPSLLDTVQCPGSIEDLKRLPLSMLIDRNNGRPWPWVLAEGQTFLPASPAFTCDDPETEREIVLAGIAFGQMPGYLAEPYLSEGRLVEVMQHDAPPPSELIMYRPQSGPVAPRVRLVYDHLVNCFSDPRVFAQSAR